MNSQTDQQLLRDYTGRRSEAAFAELVRRHVDFVHSAALRMVRDAQLAEDVTQGVFVALAQNARQLTDHAVLSGWLHRTTQNLAANAVRADVRRRAREQEAAAMNELLSAEPDAIWEHIAPQLDEALGELNEGSRDALLLRYFERKSAREMAQTLGTSEDAAQKRVSRAVERLREFFAKRGITVGASGLVVVITANAVQAAPAVMAKSITVAVLSGATASTASALSFLEILTFMARIKTRTLLVAGIGTLAVITAGLYSYNSIHKAADDADGTAQTADSSRVAANGERGGPRTRRTTLNKNNADSSLDVANLANAIAHLRAVLHTAPTNNSVFNGSEITQAIQEFGSSREAAFPILKEITNDPEKSTRLGAIFGVGQLGKSVPEAAPFLWDLIYSASHNSIDRFIAFSALRTIGFGPEDIPALAKLLSDPVSNRNLLTRDVPKAIADLLEQNPQAATPYLSSVESLLNDPNADTRFRAALALIKYEGAGNPKILEEISTLFQRPNERPDRYYKMLATDLLDKAGPSAKPLVPDLLSFAKSADSQGIRDQAFLAVGHIDPDLRNQIPEVDEALKKEENTNALSK